jgi:hypothetical protein
MGKSSKYGKQAANTTVGKYKQSSPNKEMQK